MKVIEYKVTFSEGDSAIYEVESANITTGFVAAVHLALLDLREVSRIEFWQVKS